VGTFSVRGQARSTRLAGCSPRRQAGNRCPPKGSREGNYRAPRTTTHSGTWCPADTGLGKVEHVRTEASHPTPLPVPLSQWSTARRRTTSPLLLAMARLYITPAPPELRIPMPPPLGREVEPRRSGRVRDPVCRDPTRPPAVTRSGRWTRPPPLIQARRPEGAGAPQVSPGRSRRSYPRGYFLRPGALTVSRQVTPPTPARRTAKGSPANRFKDLACILRCGAGSPHTSRPGASATPASPNELPTRRARMGGDRRPRTTQRPRTTEGPTRR